MKNKMKKILMKKIILKKMIPMIALLATSSAHALVNLDIVADGNLMKTTTDTGTNLGLGAGALISIDPLSDTVLQTGILYQNRKPSFSVAEFSYKYITLPAMLRYSVLPMINVGAGIYYSKLNGDITGSVGSTEVKISPSSVGFLTSDYGIIVGGGVRLPMGLMHFVANLNYFIGLRDVDSSAVTEKWSGLDAQVGIGLGI